MKYAMGTVNAVRAAGVSAAVTHEAVGANHLEGYALKEFAKSAVGSDGHRRARLIGIFVRAYESVAAKLRGY